MTKLTKKVIDGVAPVTLSECVYIGDKDNSTLKEKLLGIKNKYPQCLNFKGSFDWKGLKETFFDNCQKGDFWINMNRPFSSRQAAENTQRTSPGENCA